MASTSGDSSDDAAEGAEGAEEKQKRLRALLLGGGGNAANGGGERALGRFGGKGWAAAADPDAANGAGSDDDEDVSDAEVCPCRVCDQLDHSISAALRIKLRKTSCSLC